MLSFILERRRIFWVVALFIAVLAAAYLAKGFREFFNPDPMVGAVDVQRRWVEDHYVFRGKNPFDVAYANDPSLVKYRPRGQTDVQRDARVDPDLAVPEGVVYPPWTYPLSELFLWIGRSVLRPWYAALMAACMGVIAWVVHTMSRRQLADREPAIAGRFALLMTLLALSLSSWPFAIYGGNFPTVVMASLAGAWFLDERRHPVPAGFLLAMAMIKPSVGAPFFLAFLIKRRWTTVGTCVAVLTLASGLTWALTATDPIEMFHQMSGMTSRWVGNAPGPIQSMIAAGVNRDLAVRLTLLVGGGLGLGAMLLLAQENLMTLLAIAGVTARFWSYHYAYDDNCLLFLLLAWAVQVANRQAPRSEQPRRIAGGFVETMFWVLVLTLLLPQRFMENRPLAFWAQQAVWFLSALTLTLSIGRTQNRRAAVTAEVKPRETSAGTMRQPA